MNAVYGVMLIDGHLVEGSSTFPISNPYTGEHVGYAPIASDGQVLEALEKAASAPIYEGKQRAAWLRTIAEKLREQKEDFASLITAELGVCVKQSRYELDRSYAVFMQAAGVAEVIDEQDHTQHYALADDKAQLKVISESLDLVVGITPFNHPLNQIAHKIAPAIAAGTHLVLKPSEKTPLTALKFGELLNEIIPPNMVNIVTGFPPQVIVEQLVTHHSVEMVSFTGGYEAGCSILRMIEEAGKGLAKRVMELGGSSPVIILDDTDLDLAARICLGAFDNSGQRCTAVRRVFLDNKIADSFISLFCEKVSQLKYGDPFDPTMDLGCVVSESAAVEIQRRVDQALVHGAQLIYGNVRKGALYSPTIVDHVDPQEELVVKETFGPVASIIRFDTLEEALEKVSISPYRLAGAAVTRSKKRAEEVAKAIRVGQFSWNGTPGYRTEQAPFGGFGHSGNYEKEGVICAAGGMRRVRTFYTHHG